jgi:hypothetical protein
VLAAREAHNFHAVGRLAPGVAVERARAGLGAIARRLKAEYGNDTRMADVAVVPLHDHLVGSLRPALLFVVACANVLSMLLARAVTREHELTVRVALGAGRWRLILTSVDPGFRTDGALFMDLAAPYPSDPDRQAELARFYATVMERVRVLPGVASVGGITFRCSRLRAGAARLPR